MSNLRDVDTTESSLFSNTCPIEKDLYKQKKEYYNDYIPQQVQYIIMEKTYYIMKNPNINKIYKTLEECDAILYDLYTNKEKMYYIVKHPTNNNKVYKTPEECDAILYDLSTKIVLGNYDIILSKLLKQYEIYLREFYMFYSLDIVSIMFRVLTKEYYKFIKYYMKYDVAKPEYDNESDEMIVRNMNSYKKKEERKKYKNLTITIPVYTPPYRYNTKPKV